MQNFSNFNLNVVFGPSLALAGFIGCLMFVLVSMIYKSINGDKYGAVREVRNDGLRIFGAILVIGIIITLIQIG